MADRTITTDLVGNDKSLSKTLDKAGDSATKNSKKMEKFGKSVSDFGKGTSKASGQLLKWTAILGGGAATLVHAASAAHALAAGTVALSGTLGVLPGIAVAGAVGIGTLKLATKGFAAAVQNANPKKLSAEMKALSPNARATAKAIHSIGPELKSLQRGVQNRFFAGMAKDVKPLAHQYLPLLKTNLGAVGGSLGGVVRDFAGFLRTPAATKLVATTLVSVASAFGFIRTALKPLGPAILKIVAASAVFLPSITAGLSGLTTRFGAFITKVTSSGQFTAWVRTGIDALIALGHGFMVVGHTVANFVTNVSNGGGVQGMFAQIKAGSDAVTAVLPQVLAAVVALAPAFVNLVQVSGGSFASTLHLAATAAIALAPALTSITHALLPMAPVLGRIVPLLYLGGKGLQLFGAAAALFGKEGAIVTGVTKAWAAAQWLLNIAMDANPLTIGIAGLITFSALMVLAYKKSELFRTVVLAVFKAVADAVLGKVSGIIGGFQSFFAVLGHLPGAAGKAFRAAADAAGRAKDKVDSLKHSIDTIQSKKVTIKVVTVYSSQLADYQSHSQGEHRAGGGPVTRGKAYIVGEHRPELFVPSQSGTIVPEVPSTRAGWNGGGGDTYVFQISGVVASSHGQLAEQIVRAFERRPAGGRKLPPTAT